jgi:hypothetical protein
MEAFGWMNKGGDLYRETRREVLMPARRDQARSKRAMPVRERGSRQQLRQANPAAARWAATRS